MVHELPRRSPTEMCKPQQVYMCESSHMESGKAHQRVGPHSYLKETPFCRDAAVRLGGTSKDFRRLFVFVV